VPYKDANSVSVIGTTLNSGDPLRTQSRVLRVWIAPWEDSDGDLNDQSYSYLVVDSGRWMIDQSRRNIANEYAPSKPPTGINATNNIRPNQKNGDSPTGEMP
jgi:conjugal transfer pilus assembly protein TraV